jgi:hypothetical protein
MRLRSPKLRNATQPSRAHAEAPATLAPHHAVAHENDQPQLNPTRKRFHVGIRLKTSTFLARRHSDHSEATPAARPTRLPPIAAKLLHHSDDKQWRFPLCSAIASRNSNLCLSTSTFPSSIVAAYAMTLDRSVAYSSAPSRERAVM